MTGTVAIIPARGGSKRLPRKNILEIMGQPMLSYPVKTALKTRCFDQVIVSTEDPEIAGTAESAGARVMLRPQGLAQDRATVAQVCAHVIEELAQKNLHPQAFCCIYATAIFVLAQEIRDARDQLLRENGPDVVMGTSEFNLRPVQALSRGENGYLSYHWPEFLGVQSQFQPDLTASNGTFYWTKTSSFTADPTFYPPKLEGFNIPWIRAIDLDTPEDFETAQLLAPLLLS